MRSVTLLSLAALAVGCAGSDSELAYRGTLDIETRGVTLFEDGRTGHAGMSGTTCAIDVTGGIADDVDLDGSDDTVLDGTRSDDSSVVLARTRDQLHIIRGMQSWSWGQEFAVTANVDLPGVKQAALTDSGVVAAGDCSVSWLTDSLMLTDTVGVPLSACDSFAVDRATGVAILSGGNEIAVVDPSGADLLSERADLVGFEPTTGAILAAVSGSSEVRALGIDGSMRWSTTVDGAITQVADLGTRGGVALMVDRGNGGSLVILDATTGQERKDFALPSVADMVISPTGTSLGMVVDRKVHFYTLR
jgi:outer membrane protein assembly factor BamB